MKRREGRNIGRVLVLAFALGAAVFCLCKATDKMGGRQQGESLKQLDRSVRKAVMLCYATEGVYPPSVTYLQEHYGIQIDEEKYTVFYEIQGDNMMPVITVLSVEE